MKVTIRKRFSLLQTINDINFGLVGMYVMPYRTFWIIFTSDLVISYTDILLVFRWVQIVLLLYPICFYFAMKEISYKNIKMSSFKSSENIQQKEGGSDRSVSDNQSSSVTLN